MNLLKLKENDDQRVIVESNDKLNEVPSYNIKNDFPVPDIKDVWKQELHFPSIERNGKKNMKKQETVFAICSEKWNKQ